MNSRTVKFPQARYSGGIPAFSECSEPLMTVVSELILEALQCLKIGAGPSTESAVEHFRDPLESIPESGVGAH